ncbi:MAG: hypothetical protein NTX86_04080 [Candidatus Dependentiae bacterium]|nr:hypothetical protein [Candidatus Dependentiae bacterium]
MHYSSKKLILSILISATVTTTMLAMAPFVPSAITLQNYCRNRYQRALQNVPQDHPTVQTHQIQTIQNHVAHNTFEEAQTAYIEFMRRIQTTHVMPAVIAHKKVCEK